MLKLIPTPMQVDFRTQEIFIGREISLVMETETTPRMEYAMNLFEKRAGISLTKEESHVRIIIDSNAEEDFFQEENASEQGYILKISQSGEIVIKAQTDVGVLYAFVTLAQLIEKREEGAVIKEAEIKDRPQFAYRSVSWLAVVETNALSYDRGDGEENYVKRFIDKLDLMVAHKINVVFTDGFGWDAERTPTYANWNRKINDAARLRGIHLCYGGYGMDYRLSMFSLYSGIVHRNRYTYPDGEIYECLGKPGITRTYGTCMSNDALMENKLAEFREFVERVHPGALYIHNMDTELDSKMWQLRCDSCKKRWPDDDITSDNGMAGAFAEYLCKISETIKSVKDGDYDGNDCLIMFISPGYLSASNTNEEVFKAVEFWAAVDRNITNGHNVFIGQREMFQPGGMIGSHEYIAQKLKNTKLGVIYFGGADALYDDQMFVSTGILTADFKGAEWVICMNGKAGLEPQALATAEWTWSGENSAFATLENSIVDWGTEYDKRSNWIIGMNLERFRPTGVYEENGFIDTACMRIWGEETGRQMAEIYRMGEDGCPPLLYMVSAELSSWVDNIPNHPLNWAKPEFSFKQFMRKSKRDFVDFRTRLVFIKKATEKAAQIAKVCAGENEDIQWMAERFEKNVRILSMYKRYADLFLELDERFECGDEVLSYRESVKNLEQEALSMRLEMETEHWEGVDNFGGSRVGMSDICEAIEYFCSLMLDSIENNDRTPHNIREFK